MVEQLSQNAPMNTMTPASLVKEMNAGADGGVTIGEALEATALTAGQKPVEWSDAAAIQAAEVRATGRTNIVPGGVAAAAQSAATLNARTTKEEDKTKLGDILAVHTQPNIFFLSKSLATKVMHTKYLKVQNCGCRFKSALQHIKHLCSCFLLFALKNFRLLIYNLNCYNGAGCDYQVTGG